MLAKKIHYKCQSCQEHYWVSPLANGDQDVIVEHPCSECGTPIKMCFKGVAELSLMEEDDPIDSKIKGGCYTCLYSSYRGLNIVCSVTNRESSTAIDKCIHYGEKK